MKKKLRRWVERRPLFWAAAFSVAAVLLADGRGSLGLLITCLLSVTLGVVGRWRLMVGSLLLASIAGGLHRADVSHRRAAREVVGEGLDVTRVVRVMEDPKAQGWGWVARVRDLESGVQYRLRARGAPEERGSVLRVEGRLFPPRQPRNPGEFDPRPWLDRKGVIGSLKADRGLEVQRAASEFWKTGDAVRSGFREAVTRGLNPVSAEAAVIRAVVLGERPGEDVLIEPFRLTGTLHVFAVSGLHVGMVGVMGWILLRFMGVPRRAALIPLVLIMFGYAWLTGMKPPAVRAAWMAAVVLGAFWFRRRPDMGNALGLAALWVVLRNGDLIFTAGVQLSFGVVLAIGLLHRPVSRAWEWICQEEMYLPRSLYGVARESGLKFRRWTAGMLTLSTSAWLGSAPLTAWHFGIVTPISVLASVLLFGPVFVLLAVALVSALCAPVPAMSENLNRVNSKVARFTLNLAKAGSAVPGGHVNLPSNRPGENFLIVYDVFEDGAACLHDSGKTALIDGAGRRNFDRVVLPSLRSMALRPTSMIATHPDGGHVGGLIGALDAFPMERGMAPVVRALGTNYREWLNSAETRNVPMVRGRKGVRYVLSDEAWIEVLSEPDGWSWQQLADERVMPIRLHWRGWRVLFISDAGWATERTLMRSGVDLKADIIVAGRHGHDASLGSGFLAATGARVVIVTHADFPPEQRVPKRWRKAIESMGLDVFHQGECGAVTIVEEGDELVIRGWLGGQERRLSR